MENASKALIMAGSVLLGILILALMVTLFLSSKDLSNEYEATKQSEAIQQFNVNFTKYLGQDLTIHQVITIYNFAIQNGFDNRSISKSVGFNIKTNQIERDMKAANIYYRQKHLGENVKVEVVYELKIDEYTEGYVSKISFGNRHIKVTALN